MKVLIIPFVFACFIQSIHAKLTQNYDKSTFLDKTNTNVKFSWKYDVNNDMLFIGLEVKATGWVGCGFAHNISGMKGYDVVMGRIRGAIATFSDRHTIGYQEPWVDLQQDYNITYSEEVNGTTTVEFHRKRLTNDSKDIDIKRGPMWVVYAYHSTADYPLPYKSQHDHQGYKQVVILPLDTPLPSNISSLSTVSSTASPSPLYTYSSEIPSTTESSSPQTAAHCSLSTRISFGFLVLVVWHFFVH